MTLTAVKQAEASNHDPGEAIKTRNHQNPTLNKNRMYFQSYLENKMMIKKRIENGNVRKQETNYINSLKIINKEPSTKRINAIELFNGLKNIDEKILATHIKAITQSRSKKVWFIEFHSNYDSNQIADRRIEINSSQFVLMDANKKEPTIDQNVTLKALIRIHWLPTILNFEKVKSEIIDLFKNNHIDVTQIEKETYKDELEGIENGVISVKTSLDVIHSEKLLELVGRNKLVNNKILIQLSGHPPKCKYCNKFEHNSKDCPRNSLRCESCKGKYHTANECNYATRIRSRQADDSDDECEDEVEDFHMEIRDEDAATKPCEQNEENQINSFPKDKLKGSENVIVTSKVLLNHLNTYQAQVLNSVRTSTPFHPNMTQVKRGIDSNSFETQDLSTKYPKQDDLEAQLTVEASRLIDQCSTSSTNANSQANKNKLKKLNDGENNNQNKDKKAKQKSKPSKL